MFSDMYFIGSYASWRWHIWNRCTDGIKFLDSQQKWINVNTYYDRSVISQSHTSLQNDMGCLTLKMLPIVPTDIQQDLRHVLKNGVFWALLSFLLRLPKCLSLWSGLAQFNPGFPMLITYLSGFWHSAFTLVITFLWQSIPTFKTSFSFFLLRSLSPSPKGKTKGKSPLSHLAKPDFHFRSAASSDHSFPHWPLHDFNFHDSP